MTKLHIVCDTAILREAADLSLLIVLFTLVLDHLYEAVTIYHFLHRTWQRLELPRLSLSVSEKCLRGHFPNKQVSFESTPVSQILSPYRGREQFVRIGIENTDIEYTVPRDLLCQQSSYFSAMFNSQFIESQARKTTMRKLEGVISVNSVRSMMIWINNGRLQFNTRKMSQCITDAIELARLADFCDIKSLQSVITAHVRQMLLKHMQQGMKKEYGNVDLHTRWITEDHIMSASHLPQGHSLRCLLASASVEAFLKSPKYKFERMTRECPSFASDLLAEVRQALNGRQDHRPHPIVCARDPIDEQYFLLNSTYGFNVSERDTRWETILPEKTSSNASMRCKMVFFARELCDQFAEQRRTRW
ncbi:hypothetical protein N7539_000846 [Penicillium diatomitis]|uniref:BTB domain-containing protein n=1 Tax=Penicillium diatomitis TaxID=2819901 RepID=A0A9X0C316_9EURO|nr:uncharacterized protein N7539_000846 [Penicillium diatomitis]KAJ5495730.1 hypothetical protein N7539_000846 [Penicillium diatomitis]